MCRENRGVHEGRNPTLGEETWPIKTDAMSLRLAAAWMGNGAGLRSSGQPRMAHSARCRTVRSVPPREGSGDSLGVVLMSPAHHERRSRLCARIGSPSSTRHLGERSFPICLAGRLQSFCSTRRMFGRTRAIRTANARPGILPAGRTRMSEFSKTSRIDMPLACFRSWPTGFGVRHDHLSHGIHVPQPFSNETRTWSLNSRISAWNGSPDPKDSADRRNRSPR
jgi:hypothetical protein